MPDDHMEVLIGRNNKEERDISNKSYSPIILWKGTLWALGIIVGAVILALANAVISHFGIHTSI